MDAYRLPASPDEEPLDDPARFFREGGMDGPTPSRPPAAANVCTFCWEGLADDATECAGCGRTVASMAAERAARDRQDRAWAPERILEEEAAVAEAAAEAQRKAERVGPFQAWIDLALSRRGKTIGIVVAIPTLVFGAAAGGRWLAIATTPTSPLSEMPSLATEGMEGPLTIVRVKNPPDGMRLSLLTRRGRVVANFVEGDDDRVVKVRPGRYQLRAGDLAGNWKGSIQPIRAPGGKTIILTPANETLADFHIWIAKQVARRGDDAGAAKAWRSALKFAPKNAEAHLGLAQALAGQFKFTEAREELRRAAELAPKDPRIGRLQAAITAK